MTTTSSANSSCKFPKRLKTTSSSSGFVQVVLLQDHHKKSPDDCEDSEHDQMKLVKEDIKEVSMTRNGGNSNIYLRYKECRKNHAASIGGHAVDCCREFLAAGEEGTPAAFECAACSCHRNFHRKEVENIDCHCDCSYICSASS